MTTSEPQPEVPPPSPPFQFGLRTLLLLFVVLGSSLVVFGAWGIVVFALVVGLAIYVHQVNSLWSLANLALVVLCLMCLIGMLLLPVLNSAREAGYRPSCLNRLRQIGLALTTITRQTAVSHRHTPSTRAVNRSTVGGYSYCRTWNMMRFIGRLT
jgi:hypothetical protein